MTRRFLFFASLAATTALAHIHASEARANEPISVVASFSVLGDMVEQIGGERVEVRSLVGPDSDAHVFQPTPQDARLINDAQLLIVNGLGFEGWMDRLIEASGYQGPIAVATKEVTPLEIGEEHDHEHGEEHAEHIEEHGEAHAEHEEHAEHQDHAGHEHHADHDHGDVDPHAWQSLANAKLYVATIAEALTETDPAGAESYAARRDAYLTEIAELEAEIGEIVESVPEDRRIVVTSHDAFAYFGRDYGFEFVSPQGVSTESEASAADVADLIRQIREHKISAVFVENISDERLLRQIADETDAVIGGTLYPGALSGPDGPAPTYLGMMRHNIRTLATALAS